MIPLNASGSAIYSTLTGSTALTGLLAGTASVYYMQAPQGAALPYVIVNRQAGVPKRTLGGGRAWDEGVYLVKAVTDEPSALKANRIAQQVDTLLDRQDLTIAGTASLMCHRETDVSYPENTQDGRRLNHVGATYRIGVL